MTASNVYGVPTDYWFASRKINGGGSNLYYCVSSVNFNTTSNVSVFTIYQSFDNSSKLLQKAIRPILTLKADIQIISGDGRSADTAYAFE